MTCPYISYVPQCVLQICMSMYNWGIGAHHMTATSMAIFQRFADGCGAASPTIGKLSKEVFGLLIKQ